MFKKYWSLKKSWLVFFERLKNLLQYIKNNLINSDDKIQVNVKPWGYDKMYMDKDLIEDKLYQLVDQFNERKSNHRDFYSTLLNHIHLIYNGNGRTSKILFVSSSVEYKFLIFLGWEYWNILVNIRIFGTFCEFLRFLVNTRILKQFGE